MAQKRYLDRLNMSKQEVKERQNYDRNQNNHKLLNKLVETDRRHKEYSEKKNKKKHYNSYFINKKEDSRIKLDNFGLYSRMLQQRSAVPPLQELKKDFK